jgi:long-chain acyl-CoA synthetase
LPLYHAHAFGFGLMTALCTAGHLVFTERLEPFTWAEVIRAERVTVTSVVPSHLPILLAARVTREKAETLRRMLVSSAPLPAQLAREFEEKTKIPLTLGWGLSEYTNFACCVPANLPDEERTRYLFEWEVPSIGPALRGSEVKVVRPDGEDAAAEERGELLVRGHSMMQGYLHDDETTARTITADGWLRTGDEGMYREHDGRRVYFVTGRLKEVIIRDAEKFSPLALERRITVAVPELLGKLVVLGFPHATHGEEIGAYVEIPMLDEGLRARLVAVLEAMPPAERPKVVLSGDRAIARTHTGKVQRGKMQAWFERYRDHKGPVVWAPVS